MKKKSKIDKGDDFFFGEFFDFFDDFLNFQQNFSIFDGRLQGRIENFFEKIKNFIWKIIKCKKMAAMAAYKVEIKIVRRPCRRHVLYYSFEICERGNRQQHTGVFFIFRKWPRASRTRSKNVNLGTLKIHYFWLR